MPTGQGGVSAAEEGTRQTSWEPTGNPETTLSSLIRGKWWLPPKGSNNPMTFLIIPVPRLTLPEKREGAPQVLTSMPRRGEEAGSWAGNVHTVHIDGTGLPTGARAGATGALEAGGQEEIG